MSSSEQGQRCTHSLIRLLILLVTVPKTTHHLIYYTFTCNITWATSNLSSECVLNYLDLRVGKLKKEKKKPQV